MGWMTTLMVFHATYSSAFEKNADGLSRVARRGKPRAGIECSLLDLDFLISLSLNRIVMDFVRP